MATLTIESFRDEHVDAAAELLAARQRARRQDEPLLPVRFAENEGARAAVSAAWGEPGARGVAALRGDELAGYLIMAPKIDATWGRSAWARLAGHALAREAEAELSRDLYASLAPHWVERGCLVHYVVAPASDRAALDRWFSLGFGQQQAHAILALPAASVAEPRLDPAVMVRRAGPGDLDQLLDVAGVVGMHQAQSPVYAAFLPEVRDDWREDYAALLADAHAAVWIALEAGQVLGFTLLLPEEPGDSAISVPERSIDLVLAGTRASERGRGIGRALAARALDSAAEDGFAACIADWRTANLLASRFWPRLGFHPVAYRLERRIDGRVLWANGAC